MFQAFIKKNLLICNVIFLFEKIFIDIKFSFSLDFLYVYIIFNLIVLYRV